MVEFCEKGSFTKAKLFSELKIDRSLITNCDLEPKSGTLVRALIDLAHNLNKTVVAEGVETLETLHRLREWGCDVAQGYFISRPMSPDMVVPWLRQRATRADQS